MKAVVVKSMKTNFFPRKTGHYYYYFHDFRKPINLSIIISSRFVFVIVNVIVSLANNKNYNHEL